MSVLLGTLYTIALVGLSVYGCLGLLTLALFWRHKDDVLPDPPPLENYPPVTVQLPIFNERYVVERLIESVVGMCYPAGKLQIQIIDDSTDDTAHLARQLVQKYQQQGHNICYIHRVNRAGYKAGALANAMACASGEFIAIFDADFIPPQDFLQQTIPYFTQSPQLGLLQTRWSHLNAHSSGLTGAQAIALDKHFAIEQTVRFRADLFPKFNGTAGVWRRACLEQAGGWQTDTICEDLCLSTRAVLQGWDCRFLPHVTAPAELPTSITAYKNQQARWAKGSTQCLRKYGKQIWQSDHSLTARLYALLSMSAYATSLLLLFLLLLQVPLILTGHQFPAYYAAFSIAGLGQPLLFIASQQLLYPDWLKRLRYLPMLLVVAVGMSVVSGRAVLQALFSIQSHTFNRTPKRGRATRTTYKLPLDTALPIEIVLFLYSLIGVTVALATRHYSSLFLLLMCLVGFGYILTLTLHEYRANTKSH